LPFEDHGTWLRQMLAPEIEEKFVCYRKEETMPECELGSWVD